MKSIVMLHEDDWYEQRSWNREPYWMGQEVTCVNIMPRTIHRGHERDYIVSTTEQYFESLGFVRVSNLSRNTHLRSYNPTSWLVDMATMKYFRWGHMEHTIGARTVPRAVPSQIHLYMNEKRGMLVGKKFGI